MTKLTQTAFTAGEIAPRLSGRADLDKYHQGLASCNNMVVLPHGPVIKRPGFEYIWETEDSSKNSRLIKFEYSKEQAYILEFGDENIRVYKETGVIEASPGVPVDVVSPYDETEIFDVKYCQNADLMILAHPDHAPQVLTRSSDTAWTIGPITFDRPVVKTVKITNGTKASPCVITFDEDPGLLAADKIRIDGVAGLAAAAGGESILNDRDFYVKNPSGSTPFTAELYKEVGLTTAIDTSSATDYEEKLLYNGTTFLEEQPLWNGTDGYPTDCTFYDDKLTFAGTVTYPQMLWFSEGGDGNYFDFIQGASYISSLDSATWAISANTGNAIEWIVPLEKLIIGTKDGVHVMSGQNSELIGPASVSTHLQTKVGVSNVSPVSAGNAVLFLDRFSRVLSEYAYTLNSDGYTEMDLSVLAEHLTENYTIVDIAVQTSPFQIIWCVRSDGKLLGLSYNKQHSTAGWHIHETDGTFESVATLPGPEGSEVWCIVNRTINGATARYVERMETLELDTTAINSFYLDSGSVHETDVQTVTGITNASPGVVTVAGHGFSDDEHVRFYTSDTTGMTEINNKDYKVDNAATNTFTLIDVETDVAIDTTAFGTFTTGTCQESFNTITGATWLLNETVQTLGDGMVLGEVTVSGSGVLTLSRLVVKCTFGFAYNSEIETLDMSEISTVGDEKKLSKVFIKVYQSTLPNISVLTTGSTGWRQYSTAERSTSTPYDTASPLFTGYVMASAGTADVNEVKIKVTQDSPLPLTITQIAAGVT
ncbi:MAG: hypothetical protein GY710_06395 [Desulfobacteraceae bacterium]|nr:hypothetical protein [Desulfobacteraceae bacterium]